MCGGSAEWKDAKGIPRWSERSRDFFNRKYARADAATAKMTAFDAAAAETQTPGFRAERETAYRDEYGDDLQNEYVAALNEIKEGFIRGGIYNQSDYDLQKGALDANPTGQARLDALATAYVDKTKSDVSSERSTLFKIVNSLKDLEGRLPEIQNTTWDLTSPQAPPFGYWKGGVWKEEAPEFLSGVKKLYLNQAPTPVVRTGSTTQSASPTRSAKRPTMTDSMGVRTPYSRKSQKVIG